MRVLLLNLTGNVHGWENTVADEIGKRVEACENDLVYESAHGAEQLADVGKKLAGETFDFTIVVAHGNAKEPIAGLGLAPENVLNTFFTLPSILPRAWTNHKLLIICEGFNLDALATLGAGLPDTPVSEESVLIAKRAAVYGCEAVLFVDNLFGGLRRAGVSGLPTKDQVQTAFAAARSSVEWFVAEGMNIVETE